MIALATLLLLPTLVLTGPLASSNLHPKRTTRSSPVCSPDSLQCTLPRTPRSSPVCSPDSLQCTLPSLGMQINIGDGWDVRSGMPYVGGGPWNSATIQKKKINTTNEYKEILLEKETDSSERAERLSVEADLEVNVLSGLVQVRAGGKYLTDQKQSSTSLRFLINYDSKSFFSTIPFIETPVDESNVDFCSSDQLATPGGPTHVITSVQYGTKAFILFEREVQRKEKEEEISVWMGTAISAGTVGVNVSIDTNWTASWNYSTSSISLHFLGNTNSINSPTRLEEVNLCLDDLDKSSRENPQPLSFTLTRIDQICSAADVVFSSIGNPILENLATILRSLADNELRTTSLLKNEITQREVLRQALHKDYPESYSYKLNVFQGELKETLLKLLVDVRSNSTDDTALKIVIDEVNDSFFAPTRSNKFLEYLEREISSFDIFYDVPNVRVEDHRGSIQQGCQLSGSKDTYIFILNVLPKSNLAEEFFQDTLDTSARWIQNPAYVGSKFLQFRDKAFNSHAESTCFVVDLAESNSEYPVTFRVVDMFGNIQEDHENLPEISERQVTIDSHHCHWVDGHDFGDVASCAQDELAVGACAGGMYHDCDGGAAIHRLRCCQTAKNIPLRVNETNCNTVSSAYGHVTDCLARTEPRTVHKSCSSGMYRDCPLPDGGHDFNVVTCCSAGLANGMAVGTRGDDDCGDWIYGDWGWDLQCADDMVLVARCGSGRNHDCPNHSSHGIKCCNVFAL